MCDDKAAPQGPQCVSAAAVAFTVERCEGGCCSGKGSNGDYLDNHPFGLVTLD